MAIPSPRDPAPAAARGPGREDTILDAALYLFRDDRWREVTVAAIAARAGVGKGTVYLHFKAKEDIWLALALRARAPLIDALRAAAAERADPRRRFAALVAAWAAWASEPSPYWPVLREVCRPETLASVEPRLKARWRAAEAAEAGLWREALEGLDAARLLRPSPEAALLLVESLLCGMADRLWAGAASPERRAAVLIETAVAAERMLLRKKAL